MSRAPSTAARPRGPAYRADLIPSRRSFKRLIVSADGTWLNADSGSVRNSPEPSNATRITRAIKSDSADGIKQIVYYSHGVGSAGGIVDRLYGGITGEGLAGHVREAYSFLSTNYTPGDELFLFGFSRGAYTARTVAGLIDAVGLLTKSGLPYLAEIYADVRHRRDANYTPKQPNKPFRNKPSAADPRYARELEKRGYTTLGVTVKVVGVWDTVGALGTPRIGWLEKLGLQSSVSKELSFADTKVADCIENAFQALALDERRAAFRPAVWEKGKNNRTRLRQVWFPGVHSNIGGGYEDQELSNLTLAWMMGQVGDLLDFDEDYVLDEADRTEAYYEKHDQKPRPWSFGKIYNSMRGIYALGGAVTRTPGRYHRVEEGTGRETPELLQDTNEFVHPSVRARFKLAGPGSNDRGAYENIALKEWRLEVEPAEDGGKPDVFWEFEGERRDDDDDDVGERELPETLLRPLERELLEMDPGEFVEEYVLRPDSRPPRTKGGRRVSSRRR